MPNLHRRAFFATVFCSPAIAAIPTSPKSAVILHGRPLSEISGSREQLAIHALISIGELAIDELPSRSELCFVVKQLEISRDWEELLRHLRETYGRPTHP